MWMIQRIFIALFCFSVLLLFKIAIGIGLVFYSGIIHNRDLVAAREKDKGAAGKRWERQQSISQLSNIERYTVYKGRVVG